MKKKFALNIVLSLALCGMSLALFAEDAAKDAKTLAPVEAVAAEAKPAADAPAPAETKPAADATTAPAATEGVASATPAAADVNASAAPQSVAAFEGKIAEIGDAAPDTDSTVPEVKQRLDGESIDRNYVQQPPMIPHKVDEYRITMNNNKCMSCHSWDNYKKNKATKIGKSHFEDRDGNEGSTLAARRYFCTQCHAPQVDAPPLVENEFEPVKELQ